MEDLNWAQDFGKMGGIPQFKSLSMTYTHAHNCRPSFVLACAAKQTRSGANSGE